MALFDERTRLSAYGERRGRRAPDSIYLLTGLLRCSSCAERMSKQGNSYRCQSVRLGRTCDAPGGAYRPALDAAVAEIWLNRLGALEDGDLLFQAIVERLAAAADPEAALRRAAIQAALADEEASRRLLDEDHYVNRLIDRERYLRLNDALSRRIEELHRALASAPPPFVDAAWLRDVTLIRAKWSAASVREQRELLRLAIDEVKVSQGRRGARFVPGDRLTVTWAAEPSE
jgi:hypothetical protein